MSIRNKKINVKAFDIGLINKYTVYQYSLYGIYMVYLNWATRLIVSTI